MTKSLHLDWPYHTFINMQSGSMLTHLHVPEQVTETEVVQNTTLACFQIKLTEGQYKRRAQRLRQIWNLFLLDARSVLYLAICEQTHETQCFVHAVVRGHQKKQREQQVIVYVLLFALLLLVSSDHSVNNKSLFMSYTRGCHA